MVSQAGSAGRGIWWTRGVAASHEPRGVSPFEGCGSWAGIPCLIPVLRVETDGKESGRGQKGSVTAATLLNSYSALAVVRWNHKRVARNLE